MRLRAARDIVQRSHGIDDVGTLAQHHALGSLSHRGICNFGPGRTSRASQCFQYLHRPSHRDEGGLRRVTSWTSASRSKPHSTARFPARSSHRPRDARIASSRIGGGFPKPCRVSILSISPAAQPLRFVPHLPDTLRRAHEREPGDIGVLGHERKGFEVVFAQHRRAKRGFRTFIPFRLPSSRPPDAGARSEPRLLRFPPWQLRRRSCRRRTRPVRPAARSRKTPAVSHRVPGAPAL